MERGEALEKRGWSGADESREESVEKRGWSGADESEERGEESVDGNGESEGESEIEWKGQEGEWISVTRGHQAKWSYPFSRGGVVSRLSSSR